MNKGLGLSPPRKPSVWCELGSVCVSVVTLVCLPLTVGELAYRVWIYGQLLCKLGGYLQGAHNCLQATRCRTMHTEKPSFRYTPGRFLIFLSLHNPSLRPESLGWLGSRVVSVLDSGAERPGFKSQPRRCRKTVLGKVFTPIVPLFTKQRN